MSQQEQRHTALAYLRRNIRLVLAMVTLTSLALITFGELLPQDSLPWRTFLKAALTETGTAVLVAATIGVFLTEAYSELRELTIRKEVFALLDRLKELVEHPESLMTFQSLAAMEEAGLLAFYVNRKAAAEHDLQTRLEKLRNQEEPTTIYLMGDTLRVFFVPGGPFTHLVHRVIWQNPKVIFRVLLLNPSCRLALYRSEAETIGAPFKSDDEYRRSGLFRDVMSSTETIRSWNLAVAQARRGEAPIEVRYYDAADYCMSAIFPDVCYTSQYMYADEEAQVQTTGVPMLKYASDSLTYRRLLWSFNWVWQRTSVGVEDMLQALRGKPIVQLVRQESTNEREMAVRGTEDNPRHARQERRWTNDGVAVAFLGMQ